MVVTKQFKVDEERRGLQLQDFDDTEDDALSLCDLPLNSNFSEWNEFSDDYQSSSFDPDVFEFFSEDFTSSTKPTDNIIFCGKLIPYKGAVQNHGKEVEPKIESKNTKKRGIFPWKSRTSLSKKNRTRSCKAYKDKTLSIQEPENGGWDTDCNADKYDFKIKKASVLATPIKSTRWHVLAFGVGRAPARMRLNDIKNRQSKRHPAAKCSSDQPDVIQNGKSSHGKRAKSLWSLLRMLSLKSHPANNIVVKASVGCFPL
ncbi:hypothetical protein K2173_014396 [Erythroxylum novogranatense]|uniref:Uncharacterized protein n=1 Tax=Erythroxylum novogranatense TaxID=1862640 RepID=A0AAV8S560_9ROSI|nr:hypothetical protein K2173_014396 [Erythroxylum novogranatense]